MAGDWVSWALREANRKRLDTAARVALIRPVLLAVDVDRVVTLSLADWQRPAVIAAFWADHRVLGVFRALPGEQAADVLARMTDEARAGGALLGLPELGGARVRNRTARPRRQSVQRGQ